MSKKETEYETSNKSAKKGDWVVQNNPLNKMERYVVKEAKFQELYNVENGVELGDVTLFQAKETVTRYCVIVTEDIAEYFKNIGMAPKASQEEMLNVVKGLKQKPCRKTQTVAAWQWTEQDGEVETHVLKSNNEHVLDFVAPWGAEMPLKVGDTVMVMEDEVYRIAQTEFERTYEILKD